MGLLLTLNLPYRRGKKGTRSNWPFQHLSSSALIALSSQRTSNGLPRSLEQSRCQSDDAIHRSKGFWHHQTPHPQLNHFNPFNTHKIKSAAAVPPFLDGTPSGLGTRGYKVECVLYDTLMEQEGRRLKGKRSQSTVDNRTTIALDAR